MSEQLQQGLTFFPGLNFNEMSLAEIEAKDNNNGTLSLMTIAEFQAETGYPRPPCGSGKVVKLVTASGTTATTLTDTSIGSIDISTGVLGFWCIFGTDSGNVNTNNGIRLTLGDGSLSNPANQWEPEPLASDTIGNHEGSWALCGGTVGNQDDSFPTGSPDNTAIDQIQMGFRGSSGNAFTIYFAAPWYGLKTTPIIMLEQDDGNADTDIFFEDLNAYGLLGTLNLIATNTDGASNTSTTAVVKAATDLGHRTSVHGVSDTHVAANGGGVSPYRTAKGSAVGADTYLDVHALGGDSLLKQQLAWEYAFLELKGFRPSKDVALVSGKADQAVRTVLRNLQFNTIRGTGGDEQESVIVSCHKGYYDGGQLRAVAATLTDSATDLALIDSAITHGYSICIYYHEYAANRANVQAVLAGLRTRIDNGTCLNLTRADAYDAFVQGIVQNGSLGRSRNSRQRFLTKRPFTR